MTESTDQLAWLDEVGAVRAYQFAANEWADLATNLPAVLHNIHDGITTVEREVIRFCEAADRCREVSERARAVTEAEQAGRAEVMRAIDEGMFEPGHWTINAQRAIRDNPAYVLTLLARLVMLEKTLGDRPVVENEGKGNVTW